MSPSLKASGKRSFTINNAYHVDGCKTKFSHKDYTGRFTGYTAQRQAMKALTHLCHVKRIRGQCTLYIELRETTQGSSHKLYAYHCKRIMKKTPLSLSGKATYKYDSICKRVRIPTEKCKKSHKSSGRMKYYKHSRKHSAHKSSSASTAKKSHSRTKKTKKSKTMMNKLMNKFM